MAESKHDKQPARRENRDQNRPGTESEGGVGVQALDHLIRRNGVPDARAVVTIIEGHPRDRDSIIAQLHRTLGNQYVGQVVELLSAETPHSDAPPDQIARAGLIGTASEVPYRADMERAFGQSFGDVAAHRGEAAQAATISLGAHAYTLGEDIAFADENPSKEVVAHELTHVVQQRGGHAPAAVQAKSAVSTSSDAHELEANRVGRLVAGNEPAGTISETSGAEVSRLDAWDILNIGTGGAAAERAITKNSPGLQTFTDLTSSMILAAKYMPEEFKALFPAKDDLAGWWSFIQVTEGLLGAQLGVLILGGAPDPTFATKLAALVLQALIITFFIVMSVQLGVDAVETATKWWDSVKTAGGDPGKVDAAAKLFAHLVADLVQVIGAVADMAKVAAPHEPRVAPKRPAGSVEDAPAGEAQKAIEHARPNEHQITSPATEHIPEKVPAVEHEIRGDHPASGKRGEPNSDKMLSSGSELGVDPSPESIRQGTVRIESHPEFPTIEKKLEAKGYKLRFEEGDPHVEIVEVMTPGGDHVRYEKALVARRGMRYLDLEHELGHVDQIESFKKPMVTDRVTEGGKKYRGPDRPGMMNKTIDAITEYHNRLVEYLRLRDRGVDPEILEEHLDGLRAARKNYLNRATSGGRSRFGKDFVAEHLPDLPDLERRFYQGGESL